MLLITKIFWQEKRRSYRNMYYWFSWRANEEKVSRNGTLYFQWVDAIIERLVVYIYRCQQ